jgi:TfoX/Sxy family transcriptional regulator of competence genes
MAFDEELAERVRVVLEPESGIEEKRMFGGLAFLIHGNMAVAASGQGGLLVRMSPDDAESLVDDEQVVPMVMRGREMRGWLRVDPGAVQSERELEDWVRRSVAFAAGLPPT